MVAKPTEEWCNSSPVKIDDGGLSSDQSTSYEEEVVTPPKEKAHRTVEVMALGNRSKWWHSAPRFAECFGQNTRQRACLPSVLAKTLGKAV